MTAFRSVLALLAAILIGCAASAQQPVSVVLVHGALIDGSSWRGVYDLLRRRGLHVSVVQQPMTGFDADVAATRRSIEQQDGSVILVGHSYGGAVITAAGADPKVKALVYVAGLQPDVGETAAEAAPPKPPAGEHLRSTKDGFVFIDPAMFAHDFGADLPKPLSDYMAHAQMPIAAATFNVKLAVAAWHDNPSYAVIATDDRALDVERAKWMARRAGSKMTFVKASHAVLITQPGVVARVIERAAYSIR